MAMPSGWFIPVTAVPEWRGFQVIDRPAIRHPGGIAVRRDRNVVGAILPVTAVPSVGVVLRLIIGQTAWPFKSAPRRSCRPA